MDEIAAAYGDSCDEETIFINQKRKTPTEVSVLQIKRRKLDVSLPNIFETVSGKKRGKKYSTNQMNLLSKSRTNED